MNFLFRQFFSFFSFCFVCSLSTALEGRVWTNANGDTMEADFVSLIEFKGKSTVTFKKSDGVTYQYPLDLLSESDQHYVISGNAARERAAQLPSAPPAKTASPKPARQKSKMAKAVEDKLVVPSGNRLVEFKSDAASTPEYYAFYFSAHWCPPCRKFTPKLVDFYNRNHRANSNFEIIFVSSDRSEKDMLKYMKEARMPWPALDFNKKHQSGDITRYAGSGIPCLVVVDKNGKVVSDSYVRGNYRGPVPVMNELEKLIK